MIDHLKIGRVFLTGLSFGSTITLKALRREPRRFPRAAVQGAFACREFTRGERWALRFGRLLPGKVARLPLRRPILTYNNRAEFPALLDDRWSFYLEENGRTPIKALAHRVALLIDLDLRPVLGEIPTEVLLIQGNEDRIVARRYFDMLQAGLPRAEGAILPTVGHQPHLTHGEALASLIGDWLLPCAPAGCSEEHRSQSGCTPLHPGVTRARPCVSHLSAQADPEGSTRWIVSRRVSTMPDWTALVRGDYPWH